MSTLNWHPDALDDVHRIYRFISDSSPNTASKAITTIREAATLLKDNPRIGAPYAEFRQWPARFGKGSYIIRYSLGPEDSVLILRVWHSRENRQT